MPYRSIFDAAQEINRVLRQSRRLQSFLLLTQCVLLGTSGVTLWSIVDPKEKLDHWIFGLGIFFLCLLLYFRRTKDSCEVTPSQLALALDIKYGSETRTPLLSHTLGDPVNDEWMGKIRKHLESQKSFQRQVLQRQLATLVLPLAFVMIAMPQALGSFKGALVEVTKVAKRLTQGATLTVVQGAVDEATVNKNLVLSGKQPIKVELVAQNLVKVELASSEVSGQAPTVELRKFEPKPSGSEEGATSVELFQSFQMLPQRGTQQGAKDGYAIAFSVSENLTLHIPRVDASKPLAYFYVKQLPVPQVKLSVDTPSIQDPWPDDQPLPLKIQVNSTFPLQLVRLIIKAGQQSSSVLVANMVTEDRLELAVDHRLLLESYVDSDFAQVEIIAEAIDHAIPKPLIGRSDPLMLNTASAYGRYREALGVVRAIKTHLDQAIEKDQTDLPEEVDGLVQSMAEKSNKSPFFDGLDRMQIARFASRLAEFRETKSLDILMDTSQKINEFLFEHEIIDDRERDRDFFVAARSLSRLIEQPPKKRPVPIAVVEQRILKFLDERQIRWQMRISRLEESKVPPQYEAIKTKRVFQQSIQDSVALDSAAQSQPEKRGDQLTILSKSVVDYRKWIQDLEAAEDQMRQQDEQQRQAGIASARSVLKELQKRQGEVSTEMDRAAERTQADLDQAWIGSRLKQNANIKETRRVESQLRSLSPTAGARVQFAIKAMEQTNESGDQGKFTDAESNSDLAGRLLRQADSAAQESQQRRRGRGGRRRVTGDNYYGQSVVGGDIEIRRGYEVDRRYREDVLEEIQSTPVEDADRKLMENYLRSIIR